MTGAKVVVVSIVGDVPFTTGVFLQRELKLIGPGKVFAGDRVGETLRISRCCRCIFDFGELRNRAVTAIILGRLLPEGIFGEVESNRGIKIVVGLIVVAVRQIC